MKNIKLISLIFILTLFCTGCSIEYNINITKDSVEETINVVDNVTSTRTKSDILSHYNMWYPVFVNYVKNEETIELEDFTAKANGVEYYNKTINEINNGYNYIYKYTYDLDEYYDSYALASAFIEPTVQKNTNSLVLKSSKENLLCSYDYFEELKINITIDPNTYDINYTNSTDVNNNTYSWTLNKSNCKDSQIILTLDSDKLIIENNTNNPINKTQPEKKKDYSIYIFFIILILTILGISIIFNNLKKKNNKMNEDD